MKSTESYNPHGLMRWGLIALSLIAGTMYLLLWLTSGGTYRLVYSSAFASSALYIALCPIQSTRSLILQLRSPTKPPLRSVVLHFSTLVLIIGALLFMWF